jgi:hypothetical protein
MRSRTALPSAAADRSRKPGEKPDNSCRENPSAMVILTASLRVVGSTTLPEGR